ncbi:MAG: nuclear transport factor 2 family protein [Gemmatimonadetes bacterium]|nr:nuclear transport factor 2 family protein [Gemmatimonadota bacterium]
MLRALAAAFLLSAGACDYFMPAGREPVVMDTAYAKPSAADTIRDQVLAELEQYYADLSAREWDRFADHFWAGATIATIWQPPGDSVQRVTTTTIPEFIAQAPLGPGSREIFEERMTSAHVVGTGNLAQAWATYAARFGDPGDIDEWTGSDAFTLMKHEGRWRIVAMAYTTNQ